MILFAPFQLFLSSLSNFMMYSRKECHIILYRHLFLYIVNIVSTYNISISQEEPDVIPSLILSESCDIRSCDQVLSPSCSPRVSTHTQFSSHSPLSSHKGKRFVFQLYFRVRLGDYGSEGRGFESRLYRDWTSCLSQLTQWAQALVNLSLRKQLLRELS